MNNRIALLRESGRMTQNQLAQICNVTQQQISKIERQQSMPSLELAFAIAHALGCTIDELFEGENLHETGA